MSKTDETPRSKKRRKAPPAVTVEDREQQLIALAVNVAEEQLREGTASSQVITHFLKLGTTLAKLEREKLEKENELLKAKARALESAERSEAMYAEALKAMRKYQGADDYE